jgi:hypothetical protein
MSQLLRSAPYFPVADVERSAMHYERVLGLVARPEDISPNEKQGGTWGAFFWVRDVRALHAELRASGADKVEIHAQGLVRAGADLSAESGATVEFSPSPASSGHRGRINVRSVEGQAFEVDILGSRPCQETGGLARLLGQWGYSELSLEEVAETCRAIEGALLGPKATLVAGQTRSLRVLETTFH